MASYAELREAAQRAMRVHGELVSAKTVYRDLLETTATRFTDWECIKLLKRDRDMLALEFARGLLELEGKTL